MNTELAAQLEIDAPRATLWLNRPDVANALSAQMIADIGTAVDTLSAASDVRVLIVRGRGGRFSAGADLQEFARASKDDAAESARRSAAVLDHLAALPFPTIAAIEGHAVGGGLFLTLYCDLRLAVAGTRLGLPAASKNWLPPWALSRLAALIGPARAEQVLITADIFSAEDALKWGLVDEVIDSTEFDAAIDENAGRLAASNREVVREIRAFFAQLRGHDHSHWDRISTAAFLRGFASPEAQATIARFVAKKK